MPRAACRVPRAACRVPRAACRGPPAGMERSGGVPGVGRDALTPAGPVRRTVRAAWTDGRRTHDRSPLRHRRHARRLQLRARRCVVAGLPGDRASVDAWRLHRLIGMDSSRLLDELVPDMSEADRDTAKQYQAAYFAEHMPRCACCPGRVSCSRPWRPAATRSCSRRVPRRTSSSGCGTARRRAVGQRRDERRGRRGGQARTRHRAGRARRSGVEPWNAVMIGDAMWDVETRSRSEWPASR